jgi:hypothetical protein
VEVGWTVTGGGGSLEPRWDTTQTDGTARTRLTLGNLAGAHSVQASVPGLTPAQFTVTGTPGAAASLTKISGDGQHATVGQSVAQPLVVRLTDQFVNPIAGATVTWEVSSGGGYLSGASSVTDPLGHASIGWTLGTTTGENRATALYPGLASATFSANAQVGPPSALTIISGNGQTGVVGTRLPAVLSVRLTDAHGNPIPNTAITFNVVSGGGSVTTTATDANGEARAAWTLGGAVGTQTVSASINTLSVSFTATATPGAPATIAKVSGDAQQGTIGQPLSQPLVARVQDAFGNNAPGVTVTWTVLTGGGTSSPESATTDASGLASTTWTLGGTGGTHSIGARVSSEISTTFSANALVPGGSALLIESGNGQTGRVAEPLQVPLTVRLVDGGGSPISGVAITWTPGSGTVNPTASTTDGSGFASTAWTLGTKSGSATVEASATGVNAVSFAANVRPGFVCTLNVVGSTGQSAVINTPLPNPLWLEPRDRFGNLTGPISINPIPGFGISAGFLSAPLAADSNGVSQHVVWTLGSTIGNQFMTYSWSAQDFLCGPGIQRSVISATGLAP